MILDVIFDERGDTLCKELWVVIKTRKALYKYKSIYHKQKQKTL